MCTVASRSSINTAILKGETKGLKKGEVERDKLKTERDKLKAKLDASQAENKAKDEAFNIISKQAEQQAAIIEDLKRQLANKK